MGKNWAIAIGINQYDNLQTLNFAKRDAEAIAVWFREEVRFDQVFLFTEDSPPIPTNPPISTQPTYARLRRFLQAQFQQTLLNPEDNLWFFFAGHGKRYADKDYLMLPDSDPSDVEHSAISVEYVTERLRRCGADNVVLLLDACRDESSRSGLGIGSQHHQGVITFYSCAANQKSYEIEELQHGSFTYVLLAGLRLHGEANCATVERLDRYLNSYVPQLNYQYHKPIQNPYLKAEPPYKMYYILLDKSATLKDIESLKLHASLVENQGNLDLAEQLWTRVNFAAGGDLDAKEAFERIAIARHTKTPGKVFPSGESSESNSTSRSSDTMSPTEILELAEKIKENNRKKEEYRQAVFKEIKKQFPLDQKSLNELVSLQKSLQLTDEEALEIKQTIIAEQLAKIQKRQQEQEQRIRKEQETERLRQQHQQNLRQYQKTFSQKIAREFPIDKATRNSLKRLQQSLQLSDQEISAIEQPIINLKEAEYQNHRSQTIITPEKSRLILPSINRRQFLTYSGLGGIGLVTTVLFSEMFKTQQPISDKKQISESIPTSKPKPTSESISNKPKPSHKSTSKLELLTFKFETVTVNKTGKIVNRNPNNKAKFFKEDLGNGIILEMVEIPAGSFMMGSPESEKGRFKSESPQHQVNVPTFFMGKFEVTQEQYQQIMGKNPSYLKVNNHPVETVSWYYAINFCEKLSQKTGRIYRLPSEAEWEYACRAGTTTPFYFGETITTDLVNYNGNYTYANAPKGRYRQQTTNVRSFPPNAFGLYDMHGNVWEWCQDTWHDSYTNAPKDGIAWISQNTRSKVLRGGSSLNTPDYCRSASRYNYQNLTHGKNIGFRVVCVVGRIIQ